MGKKSRIRLTVEQKQWLENLEWYLENKVCWAGDEDLKELVQDGKYAVLMCGKPIEYAKDKAPLEGFNCPRWDFFDSLLCCDARHSAECIIKYSPGSLFRLVELDYLMELMEVRKLYSPNYRNFIEKMESKDENV